MSEDKNLELELRIIKLEEAMMKIAHAFEILTGQFE